MKELYFIFKSGENCTIYSDFLNVGNFNKLPTEITETFKKLCVECEMVKNIECVISESEFALSDLDKLVIIWESEKYYLEATNIKYHTHIYNKMDKMFYTFITYNVSKQVSVNKSFEHYYNKILYEIRKSKIEKILK